MSYQSIESLVYELSASALHFVYTFPTSQPSSPAELETQLSEFIHCALSKSCSGNYSPDISLEVLDKAWKAQKLLWQLRKQNLAELSRA